MSALGSTFTFTCLAQYQAVNEKKNKKSAMLDCFAECMIPTQKTSLMCLLRWDKKNEKEYVSEQKYRNFVLKSISGDDLRPKKS